MKLTISCIDQIAGDIRALELRDPAGAALPAFDSGAHIELHLSAGLTRRYSLTSDPADLSHYAIAVLHHPGGRGSSLLHERFKAGDTIEAEAPRTEFALAGARHSVLIAGGIGVTPILSHARELARRGASFEVHYAAHSRERMVFRDAVDGYSGGRAFYYISSEGGRMDVAATLKSSPTESHIYVCGPPGLVESVRETAAGLGMKPDQIHFESFGALWTAADESVHLELTLSGLFLDVPAGQTLLEAMEEAGVWVPYDCRRGECHMCMTQVVEGQPVHRDHCLSQAERETSMTPCVSWARGSLILEL